MEQGAEWMQEMAQQMRGAGQEVQAADLRQRAEWIRRDAEEMQQKAFQAEQEEEFQQEQTEAGARGAADAIRSTVAHTLQETTAAARVVKQETSQIATGLAQRVYEYAASQTQYSEKTFSKTYTHFTAQVLPKPKSDQIVLKHQTFLYVWFVTFFMMMCMLPISQMCFVRKQKNVTKRFTAAHI